MCPSILHSNMTEAYDICGVTVNVPMQFWKINVFDKAELQSIYQISHFPEWLSCPQGSLMATFWDQNLNREVLIKDNPLKKIDLDYQKHHRLKIPFMTSRKRNVSAQCETSVVLKREHTLSFSSGKCTRTIENTSFSVDQKMWVCIQRTKNNRGQEIQLFDPHESQWNVLSLIHFSP